jgi:hypothetical protein
MAKFQHKGAPVIAERIRFFIWRMCSLVIALLLTAVLLIADSALARTSTSVHRSGNAVVAVVRAFDGETAIYHVGRQGYSGPGHLFAARRAFTKERGDGKALNLVTVTHDGISGSVAQGAIRVLRYDPAMFPADPQHLRDAVAKRLIPAYRRERAWLPNRLAKLAPDPKRDAYDPMTIGAAPGSKRAANAGANYVGTTSAQGGEYTASRGFIHNIDARFVDAALHNEDERIRAVLPELYRYTLESLAQPQGAVWSFIHKQTVDPQFPQRGERPWEAPIWRSPNPSIDSLTETTRWGRDTAHLENTGYVHWLLTGDPLAALVVQRQAAFALGAYYEWKRGRGMSAYRGNTGQERGIFNTMSALWKSRVISRAGGNPLVWDAARAERQASQVLASYDKFQASQPAIAKVVGSPFGLINGIGTRKLADGTIVKTLRASNFMAQQYGKEPLWLWTRSGHPAVARWFAAYARQMVVRVTIIGGTKGIDGFGGSSVPFAIIGQPLATSDVAWGRWAGELSVRSNPERRSFDGAAAHTATQTEALLLLAKDAGLRVDGLDKALEAFAAQKERTTAYRYQNIQMMKHLAAPK